MIDLSYLYTFSFASSKVIDVKLHNSGQLTFWLVDSLPSWKTISFVLTLWCHQTFSPGPRYWAILLRWSWNNLLSITTRSNFVLNFSMDTKIWENILLKIGWRKCSFFSLMFIFILLRKLVTFSKCAAKLQYPSCQIVQINILKYHR